VGGRSIDPTRLWVESSLKNMLYNNMGWVFLFPFFKNIISTAKLGPGSTAQKLRRM